MLLSEYQAQLAEVIDRYARTDLIITSRLAIDARTPKIGVVKGSLEFVDNTRLEFTEYVDTRYRIEKLNYVYHCQDAATKLIFRYDNACHKPPLPIPNHKHCSDGAIIAADPPELSDVLDEVMERFCP